MQGNVSVLNVLYVLPSVRYYDATLPIDAAVRLGAKADGVVVDKTGYIIDGCHRKRRPEEGNYGLVIIGLNGRFDDWKPVAHSRFIQKVNTALGDALGDGFSETKKLAVPLHTPKHRLTRIARELTQIAGDNGLDGVVVLAGKECRVFTPADPANHCQIAYLLQND